MKDMTSNHHEDEVFRKKRVIKNPIKFKLALNEEQKEAKSKILENTITMLAGKAGSGKTLLAVQIALDGLLRRHYEKIIITRPTVSKEEIGFLPGDLREKMDPWIQPIYQNMFALYDKVKVEALIEDGKIEIVPLAFMRGRTFLDSCIIVDEAQNVTHDQMEMIATRIGLRSKMIICGDDHQTDLKSKRESGFRFLYTSMRKIKNAIGITLLKNHRDPIVDDLIKIYEEAEARGLKLGNTGTSGRSKK
ncbi:PhoH family protein [bacterium]|jgi:phosphate starvation-inducible PhoH-like protein|nr:PhoH family protein [bacterium]|tara:strand:+ start:187 stop:930 length:744 start_codon:yes stop_codon:yes gene_type:complete